MDTTTFEFSKDASRAKRNDLYDYATSTEEGNPDFAFVARQIHARSYRGEGFIHEDAVGEDGQVVEDIDKSRGKSVEYYMGFTGQGEPISTLRTITASEVDGVTELPGYKLCGDLLSEEGRQMLWSAELEGRPIKEISSFGHVPEVSSRAGLELLRHVLQESQGSDELWFFAMVTEKYQTLVHIFGPQAVRKIGDEVHFSDSRIGDVSLTPAIVDTTSFFDDIKDAILNETDPVRRRRHLKYLRNFAEGIDPATLNEDVQVLVAEDSFSVVSYGKKKGVRSVREEWSLPRRFDFSDRFDKLHAKRLIDSGEARTVIDPAWAEEFPDIPGVDDSEKSGSWFFYPWDASLVHFPDEVIYGEMRHARDRHLVTADEQASLRGKTALYAGLSVGSHVVEHMIYAGVTDAHILADFDTISVSNLNRIHAGMVNVGEQKIDHVAKDVSELDPYIEQTLLRSGVTTRYVEELAEKPHIIFDEVDDFAAKALLRMYAKAHRIPLIMATDVGYKSIIDIERHDIADVEPFNGRLSEEMIDAMLAGKLTPEQRMKITTKLIGLGNASLRLLQSVSDSSLMGFPQLEVTASQGGSLATIVARDILLGRKVPSGRRVYDARRTMKLPGEVALGDGLRILKKFIAKS